MEKNIVWHKILEDKDQLKEGRVMTVTAGHKDLCLSHFEGKYTAMDNKCDNPEECDKE